MAKILKDDNYYQVSGWMVKRLGLKGTELQLYAIIYGFSQDGESKFTGSLQYLCDFTLSSKPTVIKALKGLVDKGYIIKAEKVVNGIKFNEYSADLLVVKKLNSGGKETLPEVVKKLNSGGKETLPNNKVYNKDLNNNNINNKEQSETVASIIDKAPVELQENLNDFVEMRKKNKSAMTVKAVKLLISKLDKLSDGDIDMSNAILEQSIINGWKSVYELKGGQAGGQHRRNTSDNFEAFEGFE